MSNSNDYDNGYWFGKDSGYREGYEEGVQAERDRIKRAVDGSSSLSAPASEWSTLGAMIGGSIILTILGWCFVGLIIFLFWVGGQSGSWWFPWIWRIAFWIGIGFIVIVSILGIVMAIAECCTAKNPPEKPMDIPKLLHIQTNVEENWKKKYPIGDAEAIKEAETADDKNK